MGFEASPEPDEVEWVMRANDNRRKTVVRAGDRRKTYDAERLDDISSRRQPDRYEARILMERVEAEDMSRRTEHELKVRNSAGTTTFSITIDTDRSCLCRASSTSSGGSSSCSGRNCDNQSQTSRPSSSRPSGSGETGPLEPLLTSCLALGSSLLDTYDPNGSQRPSRESERQFESKVEDFFREATCAGYGRQVFDLYQLKKQKAAPLTSQDIVFTKLDPTEGVKVLKTKGKPDHIVDPKLLGTAKDVVAKAEGLALQPKATPDKGAGDETETK